ncbi:MAG: hypothetical protein GY749_45795 [Desulfobacteraceae bacterium]|nr:hypothetical protein [Desulfobacteraceae bacterium]
MKKTALRIGGFVAILGGILLLLQIMTMVTEKDRVVLGPGVEFKPEKPPAKKPESMEKKEHQSAKTEKSSASLPDPVKTEKSLPDKKVEPEPVAKSEVPISEPLKTEKAPVQKAESLEKTGDTSSDNKSPEKDVAEPEKTAESSDIKPESPKPARDVKTVATLRNTFPHESPKPVKDTKTPRVISLSEKEFVALDKARDNGPAGLKKTEGIYGWGLVGNYEKPDTAVQTLGGTPFAIDEAAQYYYRISLSEGKVKAVTMVGAAYSTVGIEAHDQRLPSLVKQAVRSGKVFTRPENLRYYYLFTKSTEQYIIEKVGSAFEWFISESGYDPEKAEDFRKNARVRLDVWQARRPGGGEMGVAVPIYFDYKGEKIFLPDKYFQTDPESVRLALRIDRKEY